MSTDTAASPYDSLAPHYRQLSDRRSAYLGSVEDYVVERAPKPALRMLDAGSGDGVRGRRIAARLGTVELVLAEPSSGMAGLARARKGGAKHVDGEAAAVETIWQCTIEELPLDSARFDLVTCLWNVLGHVRGWSERVEGLTRMGRLLAPGGIIVIDVNNRHNASAYGQWRVRGRRMLDALWPNERRGDVEVKWSVGDDIVYGHGHLFTPAEVRKMIAAAELRIAEQLTIDYVSGDRSHTLTRGQLVYRLAQE